MHHPVLVLCHVAFSVALSQQLDVVLVFAMCRNMMCVDTLASCMLQIGAHVMVLQVNGIAKFPYLSLECQHVDLGTVVVGRTAETAVRFGNHSSVPAHFVVRHDDGPQDDVFTISPRE